MSAKSVCVRACMHVGVSLCVCASEMFEMFVLKPGRHVIMPDKGGTQQKLNACSPHGSPEATRELSSLTSDNFPLWHLIYAAFSCLICFCAWQADSRQAKQTAWVEREANFLWHVLPLQVLLYICYSAIFLRHVTCSWGWDTSIQANFLFATCVICFFLISHLLLCLTGRHTDKSRLLTKWVATEASFPMPDLICSSLSWPNLLLC